MAALAARFDAPIVRPPLEAQLGKSAEKKELLRRMYGPTGQPRTVWTPKSRHALRVSAAFAALGYRVIQYGGATVEQYTRGGYSTGDVDLGFVDNAPSLETKAKVMQQFGCDRGIRLYEVDGVLVDLGGVAELFSTNTVNIESDEGSILLEAPEEALIQRTLVSVYPQEQPDQKLAALLMIAQALEGNIPMDWKEVERLAQLPNFKVLDVLLSYKKEVALKLGLPLDHQPQVPDSPDSPPAPSRSKWCHSIPVQTRTATQIEGARRYPSLWKTNHPKTYQDFQEALIKVPGDRVASAKAVNTNDQRSDEHRCYIVYKPGSNTPIIINKFLDDKAGAP
jgi:hypothetical protein